MNGNLVMESKTIGRKAIIAAFLAVPIMASIISTLHLVHLFLLGNPDAMSYFLSVAFEIGSVASFAALAVLHRLKKGMVILIFIVLFFMQLVGNVYYSFEYVNRMLLENPTWLASFTELLSPLFGKLAPATYKFILAIIIGVPIPLVSVSFLKSLVDYLQVSDEVKTDLFKLEAVESKEEKALIEESKIILDTDELISKKEDKRKPLWTDPFPPLVIKKNNDNGDDTALVANPFE